HAERSAGGRRRSGPGVAVRLGQPAPRRPGPLPDRDAAEDGEEREDRQQQPRNGEPEDQRDVALQPLEKALGERHAGGLRLRSEVTDEEGDHERDQRERRLRSLTLSGERPEQASEQQQVGDAIEDGVEEGAETTLLAAEPRDAAVEDVEQPGRDQQETRQESVAAQEQDGGGRVHDEREDRQLPG